MENNFKYASLDAKPENKKQSVVMRVFITRRLTNSKLGSKQSKQPTVQTKQRICIKITSSQFIKLLSFENSVIKKDVRCCFSNQ